MLVYLDPGHFKNTPGKRSPDGSLMEYEFNQDVANRALKLLIDLGVPTKLTKTMDDTGDDDASLIQRCRKANNDGADIFISIHGNAHKNEWTTAGGWEVFSYPGSVVGANLANMAVDYVYPKIKDYGIVLRGAKTANFCVIRETKMPAILIEFAFFTNQKECGLMKTADFRDSCAQGIAELVKKFFNITQPVIKPTATSWVLPAITPILGESLLTAAQLNSFVKKYNSNPPEIADYFINIGKLYGVRGDLAFCQAVLETKYFKYGGVVKASQNNYGGLGASDASGSAKFDSPRKGVLAMIQHLYAYATSLALPNTGEQLTDPRFKYVNRGSAPFFEQLAGKWAVPGYNIAKFNTMEEAYKAGDTYGQQILALFKQASNEPVNTVVKREDASDSVNQPKYTANESVFHTITKISNHRIPTVVINGNSFIDLTDIVDLFDHKALWDDVEKEVIITKK